MFNRKVLPLALVILLMGHLALPFADASSTSARSGPDFQVNEVLFDGAGSVFTSSGLVLAPDTHTVRGFCDTRHGLKLHRRLNCQEVDPPCSE